MRMDISKPFHPLGPDDDPEYCRQGGKIFCWSESNIGFELAWWLTDAGDPINDSDHVKNILIDRPFDKAWLS
jgi:hypothetical protein